MSKNSVSKTALVTGATGFLGLNITKKLVQDGWNVHAIVRNQSKLLLLKDIKEKLTLHYHDGSIKSMFNIMECTKPKIVFHLASLFLAQHQPQHIEELIQSNITFGTQLVEAMTANGIFSLVNTGTSWQHFENKDYNPVCLYAATKQAYEAILTFYTQSESLRVITLKLFDTYGPFDSRRKLFTLLRNSAKERKTLAMSPGDQLIDMVYIDDVVDAFMKASERFQKGLATNREEYVVSSGSPIPLKEVVDTYRKVTGLEVLVNWGEKFYRPREVMIPWDKGKCVPGWEPKISLEDGIRLMETNIDE